MSALEEADLSDADYRRLRGLLKQQTGIDLAEGKRTLAYSRLMRRLRETGATSFSEYLDVAQAAPEEQSHFISALTTNVTDFFREPHHFQALVSLLPELTRGRERLSVWSSASATGEEPWSIAMTLAQEALSIPWRVLGTDVDLDVLAHAERGVYAFEKLAPVPPELKARYFQHDQEYVQARVRDELRPMVHFAQLNLIGPWPMRTLFDVIFCRNVLIYFDAETRLEVVTRLAHRLRPGGVLMLGHSEGLLGAVDGLQPFGKTIFKRVGPAGAS